MNKLIIMAFALMLPMMAIADKTYNSDGSSSTTYGNKTYNSDGSSSIRTR